MELPGRVSGLLGPRGAVTFSVTIPADGLSIFIRGLVTTEGPICSLLFERCLRYAPLKPSSFYFYFIFTPPSIYLQSRFHPSKARRSDERG